MPLPEVTGSRCPFTEKSPKLKTVRRVNKHTAESATKNLRVPRALNGKTGNNPFRLNTSMMGKEILNKIKWDFSAKSKSIQKKSSLFMSCPGPRWV